MDEIDLEELGIEYSSKVEPWKQEHVLDELINSHGFTYAEIANSFDDAEVEDVGYYARKWSVNPGGGPAYTGETVPVGVSQGQWAAGGGEYAEHEIPLPKHIVDELGLVRPEYGEEEVGQRGSLVRYMLDIRDGGVTLVIDTSPAREERDRVFANERRITARPGNDHALARPPRELTRAIGLNVEGDSDTVWNKTDKDYAMGRDAALDVSGGELLSISFEPNLDPTGFLIEHESPPENEHGANPSVLDDTTERKWGKGGSPTLHPFAVESGETPTPETTGGYRFDLPKAYVEAYDLEAAVKDEKAGTPVTFTYGVVVEPIDDDSVEEVYEPAIIAEFDREPAKGEKGAVRHILSSSGGYGDDYDGEQMFVVPPKSLLSAMGLLGNDPTKEVRPAVRVDPGTNGFAIRPARDQELYNPFDQVEAYQEGEGTTDESDEEATA